MDYKEVLQHFSIQPDLFVLITDNMEKPVWRVVSGQGEYYLKQMPQPKEYLLFLIGALEHLSKQGVLLPKLVPTSSNELFYESEEGTRFVLSEAVPGDSPEFEDYLEPIIREMAKFHKASVGYEAPPGSAARSLLGTWPEFYKKKREELASLKETAKSRPSEYSSLFLKNADSFLDQIDRALSRLSSGSYQTLTEEFAQNPGLCHQDFTASNLLLTPSGELCVLDWDAFAYDIPARDLRKLLTKLLKKGKWSADVSKQVLAWYTEVNPLSDANIQALIADMEFPHQFASTVIKYYAGRTEDWTEAKCYRKLVEAIEAEAHRQEAADLLTGIGGA